MAFAGIPRRAAPKPQAPAPKPKPKVAAPPKVAPPAEPSPRAPVQNSPQDPEAAQLWSQLLHLTPEKRALAITALPPKSKERLTAHLKRQKLARGLSAETSSSSSGTSESESETASDSDSEAAWVFFCRLAEHGHRRIWVGGVVVARWSVMF